jgi:hypothetical protein
MAGEPTTDDSRAGLTDALPRIPGPVLAAGLGSLWGLFGYAVLWGHTPLEVTRRFVVSPLGTTLFAPIRAVLEAIRLVEEHIAGHPFDFSLNNWWIGLAAGAVGALLATAAFLLARGTIRGLARRSGRSQPAGGATGTSHSPEG